MVALTCLHGLFIVIHGFLLTFIQGYQKPFLKPPAMLSVSSELLVSPWGHPKV